MRRRIACRAGSRRAPRPAPCLAAAAIAGAPQSGLAAPRATARDRSQAFFPRAAMRPQFARTQRGNKRDCRWMSQHPDDPAQAHARGWRARGDTRFGISEAAVPLIESGEIVQHGRDLETVEAGRLLHQRDGALVDRLGPIVMPLIGIDLREVVECSSEIAVCWSSRARPPWPAPAAALRSISRHFSAH